MTLDTKQGSMMNTTSDAGPNRARLSALASLVTLLAKVVRGGDFQILTTAR